MLKQAPTPARKSHRRLLLQCHLLPACLRPRIFRHHHSQVFDHCFVMSVAANNLMRSLTQEHTATIASKIESDCLYAMYADASLALNVLESKCLQQPANLDHLAADGLLLFSTCRGQWTPLGPRGPRSRARISCLKCSYFKGQEPGTLHQEASGVMLLP